MRIHTIIAPFLLLLPVAALSQVQTPSGNGHFEDWLSGRQWGADKQTFEVAFGIRRSIATFSVAENGFGWHLSFTTMDETFHPWDDVTAWCRGPGTVLFHAQRTRIGRAGIYDVDPEALETIVDGYFRKFAPEAERSAPGRECTLAGLTGPDPADLSRIIELLESASEDP